MIRRLAAALALSLALVVGGGTEAAETRIVRPFEADHGSVAATPLDQFVAEAQRKADVRAAPPCSDEVFLRRAFLDLTGTLPQPAEVRTFLADRRPGRRAALVDRLLAREEFADLWALRWCDLLRVKSEFPINLWPNAAQAYHRWVREQVRTNRPYDQFARELLTASGSNFRDPPANFWRALQGRDPPSLAGAVALTFLGTRIDRWPRERRDALAAFFSRVTFKRTSEWKEEIVLHDPAPLAPLDVTFPDGTTARIASDADPRAAFADWLVRPENPWFARAAVNRTWAWLLGRGIVHEPDDLRPDNPPSVPGLLEHLERDFAKSGWDVRHLVRTIVLSRTYQTSSIARGEPAAAERVFARSPLRRLDAEVLIDALGWIGGGGEGYQSTTPEPYTFIPADRRTVTLADGSVTSPFLELFGRPARDTGLWSERNAEPSEGQLRWLRNSSDLQRRLERSPRLREVWDEARGSVAEGVRGTYALILSRFPTDDEAARARAYFAAPGRTSRDAALDLAWALVNSREFLFRH